MTEYIDKEVFRNNLETDCYGRTDIVKIGRAMDKAKVDVPSWIPVTERLPEHDGRYICNVKSFSFPGKFYQTILQYVDGGFVEGCIYTDDVTHWMPLPDAPKED